MALPVPEIWSLSVSVFYPDGTPFASQGRVKVVDIYNGIVTQLNINAIGGDGIAHLTWNKGNFQQGDVSREYPNLRYEVSDWSDRLLYVSNILMYPSATQLASVTLIDTLGAGGVGNWTPNQGSLIPEGAPAIYGYLKNLDGLPIVGERVHAKQIFIGQDGVGYVDIGEQETNSKGYYIIPLSTLKNPVSEGNAAFVGITLPADANHTEPREVVSETVTFYSMRVQIDFVADLVSEADASEWGLLQEAIENALATEELSDDYVEQKTFRNFLAKKIKWPVEKVLAYAQAWQMRRTILNRVAEYNVGLPEIERLQVVNGDGVDLLTADLLYGLTSSGVASSFDNALALTVGDLHKRWVDAISKKAIPYALNELLDDQIAKWKEIAVALLSSSTLNKDPIAKAIIAAVVGDMTKAKILLSWYLDANGNLNELEEAVATDTSAGLSENDKKLLQLMFDAHRFVEGFAEMTYAIVANGREFLEMNGGVPVFGNALSFYDVLQWPMGEWGLNPDPEPAYETWMRAIKDAALFRIQSWSSDPDRRTINLPDDFPGKNLKEQAEIYATKLMKKAEVMLLPYQLVVDLQAAIVAEPDLGDKVPDLVEFLQENPSVDLDKQTIEDLAPAIEDYVDSLIPPPTGEARDEKIASVTAQVCTAARVYRLTNDGEAVAYLIASGLDSSYAIARIPENEFIADHYKDLGGFDEARRVHRTASHHAGELLFKIAMNQETLNLQGESLQALPRTSTGVLPVKSPTDYSVEQRAGYVSLDYKAQWETLFGNMIQCACGQCQSVFSAAAYFVDLVQFLPSRMYGQLVRRRADLLNVELTCKNTNTMLPYIDLVNEVLENAVASQSFAITDAASIGEWTQVFAKTKELAELSVTALNGFTDAGLRITESAEVLKGVIASETIILDGSWRYLMKLVNAERIEVISCPQTDWTSQRLDVFPEHMNAKAYELLKQHVYPLNLPFNVWAEESRLCQKVLGTPRHEMLRVFGRADDLQQRICDYFGVDWAQAVLVDSTFAPEGDRPTDGALWGLPNSGAVTVVHPNQPDKQVSGVWHQVLENFAVFQNRSQLSTENVFKLVQSNWVAEGVGDTPLQVLPTSEEGYQTCETDLLSIDGWSVARLNRVARFLRVLRLTDLSIEQLDAWLTVVQADSDFIHLESLFNDLYFREKSGLTLPEVLALRADVGLEGAFDAAAGKTVYAALFLQDHLDQSVQAGLRKVLASALGETGLDLPKYDQNYRSLIENRMGISPADWAVLFNGLDPEDQTIHLESPNPESAALPSLNDLFRLVQYTRLTQTKLQDYVLFFRRWKGSVQQAWASRSYEEVMVLKRELQILSENNLSITDLDWLANDEGADEYLKSDADVLTFLEDLDQQASALREALNTEIVEVSTEGVDRSNMDVEDLKPKTAEEKAEAIRVLVVNELAQALELDVDRLQYLTTHRLTSVSDPTKTALAVWVDYFVADWANDPAKIAAFEALKTELHFLEKIAFVMVQTHLSLELLQYQLEIDWNGLAIWTWSNWQLVLEYNWLYQQSQVEAKDVLAIWKLVDAAPATLNADVQKVLATSQGILITDIAWMFARAELLVTDLNDPAEMVPTWVRLLDSVRLFKKLKLTQSQIESQILEEASAHSAPALRDSMQRLLGEKAWYSKVAPMRNQLRQRQRDALVGYLLNTSETDAFRDADDLYAHYLIDVQMNADMKTSRIVQANSTIQLLMQRSLLGLEPSCVLNEDKKELWKWMKNYRVWEANRKVFLYPENWLEPDLRDDKTPFFKELEAELKESDVTQESAEKALADYLEKVRTVANLLIMGAYREDGGENGVQSILHVVGRTHSMPYKYYVRQYHEKGVLNGLWTPWEEVGAEISSPTVFPAVFNNRLYLFWPTYNISTLTHQSGANDSGSGSRADWEQTSTQQNILEIKFNWVEKEQGAAWSKPKMTNSSLIQEEEVYLNLDPRDEILGAFYQFRARACTSDYMAIDVWNSRDTVITGEGDALRATQTQYYLGTFAIWKDGNSMAHPYTGDETTDVLNYIPTRSRLAGNFAIESTLALREAFNLDDFVYPAQNELLGNTPDNFRVISSNMGFFDGTDAPFFYADNGRTYLVEKVETSGKEGFAPGEQKAFRFTMVSHPMVAEFQERMTRGGLTMLMNRQTQALPVAENYYYAYNYYNYYFNVYMGYHIAGDWRAWDTAQNQFEFRYLPSSAVALPYPIDVVDFSYGSSMGIYNWELFFHVPMFIALQFQRNQKHELAHEWFHHIFDPEEGLNSYERAQRWVKKLPAGARFWKFLPFFANADADKNIAENLGLANDSNPRPDRGELRSLVDEWKNNPFNPHLIARHRIVAYQKSVVMKYLDNLVAWGDMLFRQDTIESITLATQMYILAYEILGTKPEEVPALVERTPLSTHDLRLLDLDAFGNIMLQAENAFLKPAAALRNMTQRALTEKSKDALNIGVRMLYFGTPRNEAILKYWDLVADRLFKIRNSMNIDGMKRSLALFAPPIDPGMLVRAVAGGMDINSAVSSLTASLPRYRYRRIWSKAVELCNEVKSLGGQVLSALEKKDAEALAKLRMDHEAEMIALSEAVRTLQIEEVDASIVALEKTREITQERFDYYSTIQETIDLEKDQLSHMDSAYMWTMSANVMRLIAAGMAPIPDVDSRVQIGWAAAVVPGVSIGGGAKLALAGELAAKATDLLAARENNKANVAGIKAGWRRRHDDWQLQKRLAEKELIQIDQQIEGARIRKAISEKEYENLMAQIENAQEVIAFYQDKYTNEELYSWMIGEVGKLHSRMFQLAFDMAKKAELVYQFELRLPPKSTSFVQADHWDNMTKGLLAAEKLSHDLQRMDVAYLDKHSREQEVIKNISLAQLNPIALASLQTEGSCDFAIPEWLYDLDFPGQVERRIKAVRVTIPCVAGPHTNISARLQLIDNRVRTKDKGGASYADASENYSVGMYGSPSVSISHGQNDSGMFELNFNDERYLPFEGAGAISSWGLKFGCADTDTKVRTFDYSSITDVVLSISYTAQESGSNGAAIARLDDLQGLVLDMVKSDTGTNFGRVISLKREFPELYRNLLTQYTGELALDSRHFPYMFTILPSGSTALKFADACTITIVSKPGSSPNVGSLNFGTALGATVADGVATVTLTGEALLIARTMVLLPPDDESIESQSIDDIIIQFTYQVS